MENTALELHLLQGSGSAPLSPDRLALGPSGYAGISLWKLGISKGRWFKHWEAPEQGKTNSQQTMALGQSPAQFLFMQIQFYCNTAPLCGGGFLHSGRAETFCRPQRLPGPSMKNVCWPLVYINNLEVDSNAF